MPTADRPECSPLISPDRERLNLAHRIGGTLSAVRSRAGEAIFAAAGRTTDSRLMVAAGVALSMAVNLSILPFPDAIERLWAEDGKIFIAQAASNGVLSTILAPYAGYMNAAPRVFAAIATAFPVEWWAAALNMSSVTLLAGLTYFVYVAVRDLTERRLLGLSVATYFCATPIGAETLLNAANIQWRLLGASLLVIFWTPRTKVGATVAALILILTTTSSPFGILFSGLAVVRVLLRPTRYAIALMIGGLLGGALQLYVILGTFRQTSNGIPLRSLIVRYLTRVVGDGIFGEKVAQNISYDGQVLVGLGLGIIVLASILTSTFYCSVGNALRAFVALVVSWVLFSVPVYLNPPSVTVQGLSERYYVAPAFSLILSLAFIAPIGLRDAAHARRYPWKMQPALSAAGALLLSTILAVVSSWHFYGPQLVPPQPLQWPSQLKLAKLRCESTSAARVVIATTPSGWGATVDCRRLN